MSVEQILAEKQANRNFVPAIPDYEIGKRMYAADIAYRYCVSDEMRNGWLAAEGRSTTAKYTYALGGAQ